MRNTMINNLSHSPSYDEIFTLDNLYQAYLYARKGKRKKYYIINFENSLGANLEQLYNELKTRTYRISPHKDFDIWCTAGQKQRHITAPTFRDLIVEFCVYKAIYDQFDKHLIFDSFGCRKGKGTMHCADRAHEFVRRYDPELYYLQIDIRKYYYSIDHSILRATLERVLTDKEVVDILMQFVSNRTVGVNVGSLIAQFFGIIYLNEFDHYVKRVLKIKSYIRYVDDMVFIGLTKEQAINLRLELVQILHKLNNLSLSHWKIDKLKHGLNFVGYRTYKHYRIARKRCINSFKRALKKGNDDSLESCLAHLEPSASYKYCMNLLSQSTLNHSDHIKRRLSQWQSTHTLH